MEAMRKVIDEGSITVTNTAATLVSLCASAAPDAVSLTDGKVVLLQNYSTGSYSVFATYTGETPVSTGGSEVGEEIPVGSGAYIVLGPNVSSIKLVAGGNTRVAVTVLR